MERVEALIVVALSLMVYSLAVQELRQVTAERRKVMLLMGPLIERYCFTPLLKFCQPEKYRTQP